MKTKEELNMLKEEVKALNRKLAELTDEELAIVTGGFELPGFGGDTVEVGKWYKNPGMDSQKYEFSIQPTARFYYCAEALGANRFRFKVCVMQTAGGRNDVSYAGDSILTGFGFQESSAPFPLPEGFDAF